MVGGSLSLWKVLMNSRFYRTSHTLLQLIFSSYGLRTCTASRSAYFVFAFRPLFGGVVEGTARRVEDTKQTDLNVLR